jgi:hypothetical protein
MQSVDHLLRKNLEAFGERDAEKRRTATSTIWESDNVIVDPHICTWDPKPSTMLSSTSC